MPAHVKQKKKMSLRGKVLIIILILLTGVLCFSVYKFLSEYIPQQQEQQRFSELRDLIGEDDYDTTESPTDPTTGATITRTKKYDKLFAMNPDMRAWMKVDGTAIDYPVMKNDADDGEYYLHRDFDGEYSFAGCLFIGKNCDENSDIFIVYGHNMNNGSMFGSLGEYSDIGYAKAHRDIVFDTKTERRIYRVFAAFPGEVYPDDDAYDGYFKYYANVGSFDADGYNNTLDYYRGMSYYWMDEAPKYPDQIMLLSTCYYDNVRFVVAAYRIK